MSITKQIIDLNNKYKELTGKPLRELKLPWECKEPLLEELGEIREVLWHAPQPEYRARVCFIGIEISFTEKPKKPKEPSYMWGREAGELLVSAHEQKQ